MRWIAMIMLMVMAVLMVLCYALLVMAYDANERADRMYRKWKEEHNGFDE